MKSDIEIARECRLKPIEDIARQVQIPVDELEHYGEIHCQSAGITD